MLVSGTPSIVAYAWRTATIVHGFKAMSGVPRHEGPSSVIGKITAAFEVVSSPAVGTTTAGVDGSRGGGKKNVTGKDTLTSPVPEGYSVFLQSAPDLEIPERSPPGYDALKNKQVDGSADNALTLMGERERVVTSERHCR